MGFSRAIAWAALSVGLLAGCARSSDPLYWQRLLDQTPEGGALELPAGDHASLVIRRGVTVRGQGGATRLSSLVVDGDVTAVRLESLVVQATEKAPALDVGKRASVQLNQVTVECAPRSPTGLRVGGSVDATELTVQTGCKRAFDVQRGHLVIRSSNVAAEQTAVRLVDAVLDARNVRLGVSDDKGAVLVAARSTVRLEDVSFAGGEQGILARAGRVTGREVRISGTVTGIALIEAEALLEKIWLRGPFRHAALLATDASDAHVSGLVVDDAGATGVLAVRSMVRLSKVSVSGARRDGDGDFGNAVTLLESQGEIDGLSVHNAQAAGLYAAKSTVRVEGLRVAESGVAVVAQNGARVTVDGFSKDELTGDVVSTEASTVRLGGVAGP